MSLSLSLPLGSTQTGPMNEYSLGQGRSCCRVGVDNTAVFTELFLTQFLLFSHVLLSEPPFSFFFHLPSSCVFFLPDLSIWCFFFPFSFFISVFIFPFFSACFSHVHTHYLNFLFLISFSLSICHSFETVSGP